MTSRSDDTSQYVPFRKGELVNWPVSFIVLRLHPDKSVPGLLPLPETALNIYADNPIRWQERNGFRKREVVGIYTHPLFLFPKKHTEKGGTV